MEKDAVEFPKWVVPHESHVVRKSSDGALPHVSVPAFPEFHVNRVSGEVTVCVGDEEAEKLALSEGDKPEPELEPEFDPAPEAERDPVLEQPSDEALGNHVTDKLETE